MQLLGGSDLEHGAWGIDIPVVNTENGEPGGASELSQAHDRQVMLMLVDIMDIF